jgi:hypothetical protein
MSHWEIGGSRAGSLLHLSIVCASSLGVAVRSIGDKPLRPRTLPAIALAAKTGVHAHYPPATATYLSLEQRGSAPYLWRVSQYGIVSHL